MIEVLKFLKAITDAFGPNDAVQFEQATWEKIHASIKETIAELESKEPVAKPYAYEYGRDNGDGTYSVIIDKGDLIQTAPAVYNYVRPQNARKDWPIKELFDAPPAQPAQRTEPLTTIRQVIANDAWAISFQTFGQYRTALLKLIDATPPAQPAQRTWVGSGDLEDSNAYQTPPAQTAHVHWQPIETAPKDGTVIWLATPYQYRMGSWHRNAWLDQFTFEETDNPDPTLYFRPTHWMPIPELPTNITKGGDQ